MYSLSTWNKFKHFQQHIYIQAGFQEHKEHIYKNEYQMYIKMYMNHSHLEARSLYTLTCTENTSLSQTSYVNRIFLFEHLRALQQAMFTHTTDNRRRGRLHSLTEQMEALACGRLLQGCQCHRCTDIGLSP